MSKYQEFETKMQKTLQVLERDLGSLRAGRANAAVLDRISVEYYGTPTPLNQVAAISVPEPRILAIQPWDSSLIKPIEKAILSSDIGITPSSDDKLIRLVFPQPTEERRKELAKDVKKFGEDSKVAIRSIRRDALEKFKKMQKASEITEDDLKTSENDIQKLTDKYCKDIDGMVAVKEKEIMSV